MTRQGRDDGERGYAVTLWGMMLVLVLFGFSGLAIDTWRVFTERQALAGLADSASNAGATAVDLPVYRATGEAILDEAEAAERAAGYLDTHAGGLDDDIGAAISFANGGIEVRLEREVSLSLLGWFLPDRSVPMRVTAFALPSERSLP